ncbi:hypothetical protein M4914_16145 [Streptomyces somaliensis DSM 40738]|nr:hypothetical protein [Streptomyces somaliensis]MCQ0024339.1 hypothetical protein [Streptomyces somaliensis DSM 40738]
MTTDLSKLTAAADKWSEMAGKFRILGDLYQRDVRNISAGELWIGISSQAASKRFGVTLEELRGAQKEAEAVSSLLRQAHTQLVDLRGRLEAVRDAAVKDGMRVSDRGVVTFGVDRLSQGERTAYLHDPGFLENSREKVNQWVHRIEEAVKAVSDADDGLRFALDAIVRDSDVLDGTTHGFNRNPVGIPYSSLEEAGKAANMPKGRKAIAQWWRDLEPVTRGILLRDRGDELRAAGVTAPLHQWKAPDVGSGPFNLEDVTAHDVWLHSQAVAIAAAGDFIGETGASRNMLHYLGGTGETLELDVDRMLHDDTQFRSDIERMHLVGNQDAWREKALDEFKKAGGDKVVVIPVESEAKHRVLQSDEWFHAIGSHAQNVSGMITVTPGAAGGEPEVSLEYQVNVWDRYNWDKGKSTQFPGGVTIEDEDMGRLHMVGLAREFDMRGSSSNYTHDLSGHTVPAVTPGDPGREGTRGDVSRGEEENR